METLPNLGGSQDDISKLNVEVISQELRVIRQYTTYIVWTPATGPNGFLKIEGFAPLSAETLNEAVEALKARKEEIVATNEGDQHGYEEESVSAQEQTS